jgi:hypothetical protein
MSNENNTFNVTIISDSDFAYISPTDQFWLYFVFLIPSIICSLFVLYQLLFDRTLRRNLGNHVIIVLLLTVLFCETTMYPWMLYYYYHTTTWQRSYTFCVIWGFIDWAVYMLQLLLFAWASIERHILIFHDTWVSTEKKRFIFHYLPLIIIIIYWFIFYSYVYFYPSCENTYDDSQMICMTVCLFNNFAFRAFETFFNNIISNLIIVIFSVALLLRVLWRKYLVRRELNWRKHRKMTIQLLSISALYLLITSPWALMVFLRICGLPSNVGAAFESYSLFVSYYMVILFPFVSLLSLSKLKSRMKKILQLKRPGRAVGPEPLALRNLRNNQVPPQ